MDTRTAEAPVERAHTPRDQAAPTDRRTDCPRDMEERPGLRAVAARWPHLSPGQTRRLYDLVYHRVPEQLRPPVPPARANQDQRGAPWSPGASGFPLLWAAWAEQRYARQTAAPRAAAAPAA